jgi:hypothetical protein
LLCKQRIRAELSTVLLVKAQELIDVSRDHLGAAKRWIDACLMLRTEPVCRTCKATDPRDDKDRIEQDKGGLFGDSYHWILEKNSDFQQWRNDQQSRLQWTEGDPGKGKTMLLCGIIKRVD